ncbi:cytochrome P450 monooxygenase [Polyplosphaeria fusca]|uniref:Cytochrome P450 monooxygenase n=1 Tax=Polyplosphaeria fusca TaxID=682080 RepID=A0A9P4R3R7_9PLEO|nr:cytochrome P450 monooxygenase [Polyplosphaeria fusca]
MAFEHIHSPASLLVLAIGASVVYLLGITIYRFFFSPLAKIPGPLLTRISNVPEANALKHNQRAAWVTSLFAQNPDAVAIRTGPNSVSFNHPDAVKAIYGHAVSPSGFGKSPWYDAFSTTGESLFSTRSKTRHATKRRMVAHSYSSASLYGFESIIDATLDKFFAKIQPFADAGTPFDIYFWYELFTMDLMGELALGKSFGVLDEGRATRYGTLVEQSQRFANYSGLLPFGKWNVRALSWVPIPSIQKLYKARLEYIEYARQALQGRWDASRQQKQPDGKPRQDIMQRFIEARDPETGKSMDFNELRAECSSLLVAGASTGSVTLNWMTYYLCRNPSTKSEILSQLLSLFPQNSVGVAPLPFNALNKLSLLEHTQTEVLRLHPPIGYATPRDAPPTGTTILGTYIPPYTAVGVPAASIGRKASVYPSPDDFMPERWIDGGGGDLATMKTCFLGFGYGSRQCIGRNVATMFVMKMMGQLLLRYEVELEEPGLVLGAKEFTIQKPERRYNVILRPRKVQL